MKTRKRFGQHWLTDDNVLNRIVATANLSSSDRVLEIGPGTGLLTAKILPIVGHLTVVEIDRDLCTLLRQKFSAAHFALLEGDILNIPIPPDITKVVANIPYNITGEILRLLLGTLSQPVRQFATIVLLVQREIAQRLTSSPGRSTYGAMSVRCQYLADCEWIVDIPPRSFVPPPRVHSAIVRLTPRPPRQIPARPHWMETIVGLGFAQKRKMLRNNLQTLGNREEILLVFDQLGISPQARAEDLTLEQWVSLADQTWGHFELKS